MDTTPGINDVNYIIGAHHDAKDIRNNTIKLINGRVSYEVIGGHAKNNLAELNSIYIQGGEVGKVYGGISWYDSANLNNIAISGGKITTRIVGGVSNNTKTGTAQNNTISISGNPDIANVVIYGGFNGSDNYERSERLRAGNTLNLYSNGLTAKNIHNFEFINFYLSDSVNADDTLLTLTDYWYSIDLSKSKIGVGVIDGATPNLQNGDLVTLIYSENANLIYPEDMTNNVSALKGVSTLYEFELEDDGGLNEALNARLVQAKQNEGVKSFLEAGLAGTMSVNQGADLIANDAVKSMLSSIDGSDNIGSFVVVSGSDIKAKTGSYVDTKGVSLAAGVSSKVDSTTYGAFIEAGFGDYDSYNGFANSSVVRGAGDTDYYGLGIMLHTGLVNNFYVEGSLRVGKSETDYKSNDFAGVASFDMDRTYYGAHIGVGNIIDITDNSNIDVYAKLLYTNLSSEDVTIAGDKFSFDDITSIRTRVGARYNYNISDISTLYAGAAYEREFDGKAKGYDHTNNKDIEAPELKGDSAVLELGANFLATPNLNLGANFQGYLGDKEGISGGVKAEYRF